MRASVKCSIVVLVCTLEVALLGRTYGALVALLAAGITAATAVWWAAIQRGKAENLCDKSLSTLVFPPESNLKSGLVRRSTARTEKD